MSSIVSDNSAPKEECAICYAPIEEGAWQGKQVTRLDCSHSSRFHKDCIENWLKEPARACPFCRTPPRAVPALRERVRPVPARIVRDAWRELYNPDEEPTRMQLNDLATLLRNPRTAAGTRALAVESIADWNRQGFFIAPAILELAVLDARRGEGEPVDPDIWHYIFACCMCLIFFVGK